MSEIEALIRRWQEGDDRAAELLYQRYRQRCFWLAYGLLGDRADADEAAQDALAYALMNIRQFDANRSRFSTWLHTITVSRCRDRQRRRRLRTVPLIGWLAGRLEPLSPEPGPEAHVAQRQESNQVWKSVQSLKPPLREVIVLRHWGGHTYQEIADIVGCPLGTAQSRVRRAYRKLEHQLTPAVLGAPVEES